jgi:TPR repeat protein
LILRIVAAALAAGLGVAGTSGARVDPPALAAAEARVAGRVASRGLSYPPHAVTLVALKAEGRLELWADGGTGWRFVRSYLVRATSGSLGPKLRQGDHQVPEGVYRIATLNPNSHYHLAMRIDYPNAFDRARAAEDGRARLGGDIMIHGRDVSVGCLPVGDAAVEELFALVERVGPPQVRVIVSPVDLRHVAPDRALARVRKRPKWLGGLYATIAAALGELPSPRAGGAVVPPRLRRARPQCRAYDVADCVRRCEAGDVASCARAGLLHGDGFRVAADAGKAWAFLERACAAGDAFGCAELSRLHVGDDGLRRDTGRAAALAEAACDAGDGHGCAYAAALCTSRLVYPASADRCGAERVRRLRERAVGALAGDCEGWGAYDCATLAGVYHPGDRATALRYASGACGKGDASGCQRLAQLVEAADGAGGPARRRPVAASR